MLSCVACSKQLNTTGGSIHEIVTEEDNNNGGVSVGVTPRTSKPAIKAITSQVKLFFFFFLILCLFSRFKLCD
jgi:hypothetical protein